MRLSPHLREDLVVVGLEATDQPGALGELAAQAARRESTVARAEVERGLATREAAFTTNLGHGVAVPHATLAGLERPLVLVAVAAAPVPFGPADAEPVRLFFTLLSPPGREGEHIKTLARICRLARDRAFVDEVVASPTPAAVLDVIRRADEEEG